MREIFSIPGLKPALLTKVTGASAKGMRQLVLAWLIYDITKSPFALGLIGLFEAIPYIASSLFAGQYIDRVEKRLVLLKAIGGMALCSILLLLLTTMHQPLIAGYYTIIGLLGFATSYYTVSMTTIFQETVPKEHYPQAFSANVVAYQLGVIGGPILAGFTIAHYGVIHALIIVCAFDILSLIAASLFPKHEPHPTEVEETKLQSIKSGLRFIRNHKILWAPMILDAVAVLFGDVVAILPVFAVLLGVGPEGLGILKAAPSVGALLVTGLQSIRPFLSLTWTALLRSVSIFGISMIAFALSQDFYLSIVALFIGGAADAISVVIRQSTYQAHTPKKFRGRVAAVNGIFIRTSNEIGAFESGVAASLLGTVPSVLFGGAMSLIVVGVMRWKVPRLE